MKESSHKSHLTHQEFPAPHVEYISSTGRPCLFLSPNIIKMTRAGHETKTAPSTKQEMPKTACISVDTVTKRCDWSSLRKHIQKKRCPVLFAIPVREAGAAQPSLGASVAPSEAQVESDTLQDVPYAQRPHVVSAVRRHGDNAAFHLPDRHVLTHPCALCNQWITVPGKMKQHYRLSHSATHEAFAHPAAKLC